MRCPKCGSVLISPWEDRRLHCGSCWHRWEPSYKKLKRIVTVLSDEDYFSLVYKKEVLAHLLEAQQRVWEELENNPSAGVAEIYLSSRTWVLGEDELGIGIRRWDLEYRFDRAQEILG